MVRLVPALQAAQDADGVLHRRLADQHLLEAALQRRVLLDALPVLVQRGRADHAQLAAGQHRLEHVAGVHRPLGRAGADDRVQLVDERDDLPVGLLDVGQDGLEPLLELAAVLRAGHHRAEVERDQPLVPQRLGHVTGHDPLGQPLDDGGLADAGLADEHRVVLGPAGQHLHHPADLGVPADDRVELAVAGGGGEVHAVLLQRLVRPLGVGRGDPGRAAHVLERRDQRVRGGPVPAQQLGHRTALGGQADQQVLGGQVFVGQLLGLPAAGGQHPQHRTAELRRGHGGAARRRQLGEQRVVLGPDLARVGADRPQQRAGGAVGLAEQRGEQVGRLDRGVAAAGREGLGGGERLVGARRELVRFHEGDSGCRASARFNGSKVESVPLNPAGGAAAARPPARWKAAAARSAGRRSGRGARRPPAPAR